MTSWLFGWWLVDGGKVRKDGVVGMNHSAGMYVHVPHTPVPMKDKKRTTNAEESTYTPPSQAKNESTKQMNGHRMGTWVHAPLCMQCLLLFILF